MLPQCWFIDGAIVCQTALVVMGHPHRRMPTTLCGTLRWMKVCVNDSRVQNAAVFVFAVYAIVARAQMMWVEQAGRPTLVVLKYRLHMRTPTALCGTLRRTKVCELFV